MVKVSSLGEYIAEVNKIQNQWSDVDGQMIYPWFRGHADSTFTLLPGLYRDLDYEEDPLENEIMYRQDFETKAFPFLVETYGAPANRWEWYFVMQHYGLPTRLLDWTQGSLIGLYFALFYKNEKDKSNPCVWMLNPFGLNKHFQDMVWLYSYQELRMKDYLWELFTDGKNNLPQHPIAFEPVMKSKRIVAQKGCFTLHGRDRIPLEKNEELKYHMHKIEIDHENLENIKDEIVISGISESTLFPELNGLSRELKSYWRKEKKDKELARSRTLK